MTAFDSRGLRRREASGFFDRKRGRCTRGQYAFEDSNVVDLVENRDDSGFGRRLFRFAPPVERDRCGDGFCSRRFDGLA